ncbi:MAG: arginase family protein [Conexivisphaerales archaeon]
MRKEAAAYPTPTYKDRHDRRMVSIIRRSNAPMNESVNILGIPFDGATLGRKGSSEAPRAIREALRFNSNFNPEIGISLARARIYDLGDLVLNEQDVKDVHRAIGKEVRRCIRPSSLLILIGGDNSISLPAITALSKCGNLGLIVVDSHYDMRGEIAGKPTSGSSYYLALKRHGERLKGRVAYIGQHGFLNSLFYANRAEKLGVKVFTASDVLKEGALAIARSAYSIASEGADCVYLSVDIDCVGLAEVSGVSAPSPSGLSSAQLFSICTYLASREKVKVVDVVETSPSLDQTGRSQIVAATTLCYLAAGFELRKLMKLPLRKLRG